MRRGTSRRARHVGAVAAGLLLAGICAVVVGALTALAQEHGVSLPARQGRDAAASDAPARERALEAAVAPLDRQVADRLTALRAVVQQASALHLDDASAADLERRVAEYQRLDAAARQQAAGPLLDALEQARARLSVRVADEQGLDQAAEASARRMGCPTGPATLLNRRTAPLKPGCAPGFRAGPALDRMLADMKAAGLHPVIASSYRSYATQAALYQSRVQAYGQEAAGEYTAPPGFSEHQLGLAVDLSSTGQGGRLTAAFATTPEGRWLATNAGRYGFILRYPQGKEPVTGYAFEPWHFRYVGSAAASIPAGTTLEEYLHATG